MEANNLMVVNSTDGQSSEILGKFLYYSFPRLLINKKEFKELRETKAKIWHGHLAGKLLVDVLEADLMEAVSSMGEEWEGEKADLSAAA